MEEFVLEMTMEATYVIVPQPVISAKLAHQVINVFLWQDMKFRFFDELQALVSIHILHLSLIENCELSSWSNWTWTNLDQFCGNGTKVRNVLQNPIGNGDSCETVYSCTTNCYHQTMTRPCPGIGLSEF